MAWRKNLLVILLLLCSHQMLDQILLCLEELSISLRRALDADVFAIALTQCPAQPLPEYHEPSRTVFQNSQSVVPVEEAGKTISALPHGGGLWHSVVVELWAPSAVALCHGRARQTNSYPEYEMHEVSFNLYLGTWILDLG